MKLGENKFPRSPVRNILPILFFASVWIVSFWFFSCNNQFPIYYHPDESSKGLQIVSGALNFHHPLLLLDSIRIVLGINRETPTVENAVLSGRQVSAIFSACSVVALTILAGRKGGRWAALSAALILPLHPLIYELAHYCKEDPALLLGMSLTLLFLDVFLAGPSIPRILLLGASAGLAVSGKYLGIAMLLTTLPLAIWRLKQLNMRMAVPIIVYLGGFLLVVFIINLPYFLEPSALQSGLTYEIRAASVGGNKGLSREIPHSKYVGIFRDNIGWPLWLGIACFALQCFSRINKRKGVDIFLLVFPFAYALLLSFSPKTASRYFLAVAPFLILAGTSGLFAIRSWLFRFPRWFAIGLPTLLMTYGIIVQFQLTQPSIQGFRTDSRREMADWIANNLPAGNLLAAESRIQFSRPETWPNRQLTLTTIREQQFLPDIAPFDEFRSLNIRYAAIIRTSFGGFLDEKRKPAKSLEDQHQRRADFYRELIEKGKLLKKTGGTGVGILNPEIRLYELP